jgi:hypothetical protein
LHDLQSKFFHKFNVITFFEALEFKIQLWRHKSFITNVIRLTCKLWVKDLGIDFPSVIMGWKGFKILPNNGAKNVIAQFVVWENPNPSNKCVTQLGTPITVTSIDIPLILVKENSNTREASQGDPRGIARGEERS